MDNSKKCLLRFGKCTLLLMVSAALVIGCAATRGTRQESEDASAKAPEMRQITGVTASEDADSIDIRVAGNQLLTYTSVKQPSPTGVILYFPETTTAVDKIEADAVGDSGIIDTVSIGPIAGNGPKVKLEILLKQDVAYVVNRDGNGLVVSFTKPETAPGMETAVAQPSSPVVLAKHVESITTENLDDASLVYVVADGTIQDYKSFVIENPARIVFDLWQIKSDTTQEERVLVNSPWLKQVRHFGHADRVRVVLDTEKAFLSDYTAEPTPNGLTIRIGPASETAASKKTAAAAPKQAAAPAAVPAPVPAPASAKGPAWVNRIDFASEDAGKSTLVIGTTLPVDYDIKKPADNRLHVDLYNTRLPDYRKRPLITTRFNSAVDRVTPLQDPKMAETTTFVIEMRESVPYFVEQNGSVLMVHFEPSAVSPKPLDTAALPDWQQVVEEGMAESNMVTETQLDTTPAALDEPLSIDQAVSLLTGKKTYTGEKIALDFYETDIKNVFRILREISGKNFAVDKNVTGQVTLSLDKPVPWDQVLDLVLKMNNLGMSMEGDIIRIATQETLNNERSILQAKIASEQETKEKVKALEPLITEYIPISYANAQVDVMPQIIITPERGSVTVDQRNNQIIITDTASMVEKAKATIHRIDKVTPQVMIEARVVEANNTFSRSIGVEWAIEAGPIFTKESVGGLIPEGALDLEMSASNAVVGDGEIGISFTKLTGTPFSLVSATLTASESKGMIKIIAAPRVLTLDNKAASIKQGLAYPLTKLDADGNTVVEFQDVALELTVTPHVTPDNRISLAVRVSNNEIGPVINGETSFTTKEANTELLVNDGDTIVIGGIRKARKGRNEDGVPGLKDVPLLGWLFKRTDITDDFEELLIFITPNIVMLEQRT